MLMGGAKGLGLDMVGHSYQRAASKLSRNSKLIRNYSRSTRVKSLAAALTVA